MPALFRQTCPLFPVRLTKSVRMRMRAVEKLLADPDLPNLKVIALFRYNIRRGTRQNYLKQNFGITANPGFPRNLREFNLNRCNAEIT